MRICVVSDTHIPQRAKGLPDKLIEEIKKSDVVIHAGDFTTYDVYLELCAYKPVFAVRGNMDDEQIFNTLPEKRIEKFEGVTVGIFHGMGAPFGIEKRVLSKFDDVKLDIIVFGHSHKSLFKKMNNGVVLINPGSPTDRIFAKRRTFGILEITDRTFQFELEDVQ